ncbi:MAG: RNA polymerase sigma factor [Gemmatimonadaceae bacterium]|nr:RNA polymerase sigma factor [Gemmatimonadaceae bacterium]
MDDAALLQAAAGGDAAAFGVFMRTHEAAVHRYLLSLIGAGADEEDALQETFINAWRSAGSFAGRGAARGWLYAIARNVVHHQVRRRVGEPEHVESLEELAESAGWGAPATDDHAGATIARELLDAGLRRLPAEEREVLVLRELDGFSGEETAALIGISLPAMKSRLHRARVHLAAAVRALDTTTTDRSIANA